MEVTLMKIDGAFSGGGVKAYAFLGVLEELEARNYTFDRVAGSSAGAILAGFLAAGYTNEEIKELFFDLDLEQFMDGAQLEKYFPFVKWISLYFSLGLYKGNVLEKWIHDRLAEKNVYTFADIPKDKLKITVTDLTSGEIVVIPDDLNPVYGLNPNHFPISKAIRMSASLPYFFRPKKIYNRKSKKHLIVDGAVLSNLPMWIFDSDRTYQKRPLLGVKLSASYEQIMLDKVTNALGLTKALIKTMQVAHDQRYINKHHKDSVIFLPVANVPASDFKLTDDTKKELIDLGRDRTQSFLSRWPH